MALIDRKDAPPEIRRVHKRIAKACAGARLDHVAGALLLEYIDVLLHGSTSYEQFRRNADGAASALDASARAYFKINN